MVRRNLATVAVALTIGTAVTPAFAAVTSYDFSTVSGSSTPLTLDGATFSSPSDPGAYTVGPNGGLFSTLGSTVLSSAGVASALDISFAAPVTAIAFNFGLDDLGGVGDTLSFTPGGGAALIASAATPLGDLFPQGSVSYSGASFDTAVITSSVPLVIADLTTTAATTSVPEPATFGLLATGLLGLTWLRRRA